MVVRYLNQSLTHIFYTFSCTKIIFSELNITCNVMKTRSQRKSKESENVASITENIIELECAICLQQCVHPVQLNCQHIFCYLCVKGVQKKQCPMCRSDISPESIDQPNLVKDGKELSSKFKSDAENDTYSWFYKGQNGWWEYEQRDLSDLEKAYTAAMDHEKGNSSTVKDKTCELLIAGHLYIIDFQQMIQYRKDQPFRKRNVKREKQDKVSDFKGVAGLRIGL